MKTQSPFEFVHSVCYVCCICCIVYSCNDCVCESDRLHLVVCWLLNSYWMPLWGPWLGLHPIIGWPPLPKWMKVMHVFLLCFKSLRTYTVNADHKALSDATGMRMKENKEFQASETDYIEAISASKNAIVVLGKHNPALAQLRTAAHTLLDARMTQMVDGHVSKANVGVLRSFLHNAESATSFLAIPGMRRYAPQLLQIYSKNVANMYHKSTPNELKMHNTCIEIY